MNNKHALMISLTLVVIALSLVVSTLFAQTTPSTPPTIAPPTPNPTPSLHLQTILSNDNPQPLETITYGILLTNTIRSYNLYSRPVITITVPNGLKPEKFFTHRYYEETVDENESVGDYVIVWTPLLGSGNAYPVYPSLFYLVAQVEENAYAEFGVVTLTVETDDGRIISHPITIQPPPDTVPTPTPPPAVESQLSIGVTADNDNPQPLERVKYTITLTDTFGSIPVVTVTLPHGISRVFHNANTNDCGHLAELTEVGTHEAIVCRPSIDPLLSILNYPAALTINAEVDANASDFGTVTLTVETDMGHFMSYPVTIDPSAPPPTPTPAWAGLPLLLTCGEIVTRDNQVTIPIITDFVGQPIDSMRMEMLFDTAILSNPNIEMGSDFDIVGAEVVQDNLLGTVYGRSQTMLPIDGMVDYGTITFDWTGEPTSITFNNPHPDGETAGTRGYIQGSPLDFETAECIIDEGLPTHTPLIPAQTPTSISISITTATSTPTPITRTPTSTPTRPPPHLQAIISNDKPQPLEEIRYAVILTSTTDFYPRSTITVTVPNGLLLYENLHHSIYDNDGDVSSLQGVDEQIIVWTQKHNWIRSNPLIIQFVAQVEENAYADFGVITLTVEMDDGQFISHPITIQPPTTPPPPLESELFMEVTVDNDNPRPLERVEYTITLTDTLGSTPTVTATISHGLNRILYHPLRLLLQPTDETFVWRPKISPSLSLYNYPTIPRILAISGYVEENADVDFGTIMLTVETDRGHFISKPITIAPPIPTSIPTPAWADLPLLLTCGEIVTRDNQITIPIIADFVGQSIDSMRMEMLFDTTILSNPNIEMGSDFDIVGAEVVHDNLLGAVYGRSQTMLPIDGMVDYGTITFDWTGEPTSITFNEPHPDGETVGSRGYIQGSPVDFETEGCVIDENAPTPLPQANDSWGAGGGINYSVESLLDDYEANGVSDGVDFGDLPDTYSTRGSRAAVHFIVSDESQIVLGDKITTESDGQPDNLYAWVDADEGVPYPRRFVANETKTLEVTVSGKVPLEGTPLGVWLDWDHSGQFSEDEFLPFTVTTGVNAISITTPHDYEEDALAVRFRLFSPDNVPGGTLDWTDFEGAAVNGEVEDYMIYEYTAPTMVNQVTTRNSDLLNGVTLLSALLLLTAGVVRRGRAVS